jgi:hypothetical protein
VSARRGDVSGLDWTHKVRDSKDLVIAAKARKYRRDCLDDPAAPKVIAPQTLKGVALTIGAWMNAYGVAEVSIETICQRSKYTPPTVRNAIRLLVAEGWLSVEPGGGKGHVNRYLARLPAHAEFYKTGCRETPYSEAADRETGSSESQTGRPVTPKKRDEELRPRGGQGPKHTQLVGEGTAA